MSPADHDELWRRIEVRFGLTPSMLPSDQLAASVGERARRRGMAEADYLRGVDDGELRALAEQVAVGETFFLRHAEQLEAALQHLLGLGRPARAISLGCATGEEPYSLAMIWLGGAPGRGAELRIDAVDLSEQALRKARAGDYGEWALRALPATLRHRWFRRRGARRWALDDEVRAMVSFSPANLADPLDPVWARGPYDVVLCRNVLMYFAPETARKIVGRIARMLAPDGVVMLGHAETLRGLSDALTVQQRDGAFVYTLPRPSPPKPMRPAPPPPAPPVGTAPAGPASLPDREAEEAVAALDHGDLAAARCAANTLLARPGPDRGAVAHHILGLCAEAEGDVALAILEHTRAAAADPALSDAWLHLGRLQRRRGAIASARTALERARLLLEREPMWRIETWAPGFDRASLLALVDAELAACRRPA